MPERAAELAVALAGRDRELERGVRAVHQALAGHGRLVLLSGEAGIGKTRLAEEIALAAGQRGARVTWARAADPDSSPPYGLWRLVLANLGRDLQPDEDLWSLTFGSPGPDAAGSDSGVARGQRFALFDAVRAYLDRAARPSGLVVVLDDVQWADEPSLLLLAHLVRQLPAMPAAVIASWRGPGEAASPVPEALAADSATDRHEAYIGR